MSSDSQVMMSEHVMSSGVCVVQVWAELLLAGQVEVRAGLSDGCFLLLHRTDEDLAQMMKRLVDSFLDDREMLSSNLLTGLLRVRAADQISDVQVKTVELNKLLQIIISLPTKFSQSEAVLDFFKPSPVDQIVRQVQDHSWRRINPPTISHEDQKVNHSMWHADQDKDQTLWNDEQKVDQSMRHEDHKADQCIRYDNQMVDQAIGKEDQELDRSIRHANQKVDQSLWHEDQDKDQSLQNEEKDKDQSLWHDHDKVDQSSRHEDHKVDQLIRHDNLKVDQTFRHKDQKMDQIIKHEDQKVGQSLWHEDQDLRDFQSLALSDIWRSNGFCLANTETILFDLTPPTTCVTKSEDSTARR